MVKKITAYSSSDGSIFASSIEAETYDARQALSKIDGLNEGIINALLKQREKVHTIFSQLCGPRGLEDN